MTDAAGPAIHTEDLRKTYKSSRGDVPAVRGIDLSVGSGQFFGLLGPNGAGKSTTIGMLTTLVLPTGGRAWVAGLDVVADPVGVKRRIGVVTQNNTLDMQLTVAENLEFRSRFFGLGLREASRRASQLLEVFGLADRRKAMSTDLSGGQAKRLLIARALVHRPDVLFLDEPTAGLDPQTRVNLWDILRVLHAEGQTILLTTHYMEEAEALCEQIAVIDHGEVLASGTVNELKEGAGAETVITVRYEAPGAEQRVTNGECGFDETARAVHVEHDCASVLLIRLVNRTLDQMGHPIVDRSGNRDNDDGVAYLTSGGESAEAPE